MNIGQIDISFTVVFFLITVPENQMICLCWGFTAQSTQWGHVKRGQFT